MNSTSFAQYELVTHIEHEDGGARLSRRISGFGLSLGYGILLSERAAEVLPLRAEADENFFCTAEPANVLSVVERYDREDAPYSLIVEVPLMEEPIFGASHHVYSVLTDEYRKSFSGSLSRLSAVGLVTYDRDALFRYGQKALDDQASCFLSGLCGHSYRFECWYNGALMMERFEGPRRDRMYGVSAVTADELRDELLRVVDNGCRDVVCKLVESLRGPGLSRRLDFGGPDVESEYAIQI